MDEREEEAMEGSMCLSIEFNLRSVAEPWAGCDDNCGCILTAFFVFPQLKCAAFFLELTVDGLIAWERLT